MSAIEYANQIADLLNRKFAQDNYYRWGVNTSGKKYIRVYHESVKGHSRSVYCFVDANGNVYKSAGWKSPAKGVRYNVSTEEGLRRFLYNADKFGSGLYIGGSQEVPEDWEIDF